MLHRVSQKVVSQRVPVIHHPSFARRHKARAIDDIRFATEQGPEKFRIFARVVFKIGVLNNAVGPCRGGNGCPDGCTLAAILFVADEPDAAIRPRRHKSLHRFRRAIV